MKWTKHQAVLLFVLIVSCLCMACSSQKNAEPYTPSLARNDDPKDGFGVISLSVLGYPEVDITYSCVYSEPDAPVQNESETITPKEAALSGSMMLYQSFGADAIQGDIGVRYCEKARQRPWYEVYVEGSGMDSARYAAKVDAQTGVPFYGAHSFYEARRVITYDSAEITETEMEQIVQRCSEETIAWVEAFYGYAFEMRQPLMCALYSYTSEKYDANCVMFIHTGDKHDFYLRYLVDTDDETYPLTLLSVEVAYQQEVSGEILDFQTVYQDTFFTQSRIQHIFRVLCGDAQPYVFMETQADRQQDIDTLQRAIALSKIYPGIEITSMKRESEVETRYYTLGQRILDLKEGMGDLPTERIPADLSLIQATAVGSVIVPQQEGAPKRFSIFNRESNGLFYKNEALYRLYDQPNTGTLFLTETAADAAMQQLLSDIGADDFALWSIKPEMVAVNYSGLTDDALKTKVWKMLYLKADDPMLATEQGEFDYPNATQATITIRLGDEGILSLNWSEPKRITPAWGQ